MSTLSSNKDQRDAFSGRSGSVTDGGARDDLVKTSNVSDEPLSANSDDALGVPGGSYRLSVLIYSSDFAPSVGGRPSIARNLAGHYAASILLKDVTVVTPTPRGSIDDFQFSFRVVREPSLVRLFALVRKTDVLVVIGADILPMVVGSLLRKFVVVQHHKFHAVCPAGNYLKQPECTPCVGHFRKGNHLECYRCLRMEKSRTSSIRDLFLTFPRLWLVNRVAANAAPTHNAARRLGLPRTEMDHHAV